jgi:hypothetical protein
MSNEDKDMKISEELDGSAVVNLPADMDNPQNDDDSDDSSEETMASGSSADDEDHPDDSDAVRSARRNRRKTKREHVKSVNAEKDARLQNLLNANQKLQERLSIVEKKTHSSELARIDKAIEDQELRLQYARMKMAEATNAGDGEASAKAQELWYDTRRQVEALKSIKGQAVKNGVDQPIQQDNGEMQRQAGKWMDRNEWYDPAGNDEDSEIAKVIDQKLVKDGWNPNSSEYWSELDKRLQKRLPHRYTDETDDRPTRNRPTRSAVTSGGRENFGGSGAKNTFTLSPEQVRAMKDAGMWDDAAKRSKMIKRYAIDSRTNSRN